MVNDISSADRGAARLVALAMVVAGVIIAAVVLSSTDDEQGADAPPEATPETAEAASAPEPMEEAAPPKPVNAEPPPTVTVGDVAPEPVADPDNFDGPQLSPGEVLKGAGIEIAFRSEMTLTGGRDAFRVGLGPGKPSVVIRRSPFDPKTRRTKEEPAKAGDFKRMVTSRGRRFECTSEAPGESLKSVEELCSSISAAPPVGQVVGIDCQSTNIDRDLFTVLLRGEDEAIRECFTASWVIAPGTGRAGFGFRGDVTSDGVVETLEIAADVPDYPAYEELRGCVYPIFKSMTHKMVVSEPGQVSCELRWDASAEPPENPPGSGSE